MQEIIYEAEPEKKCHAYMVFENLDHNPEEIICCPYILYPSLKPHLS